MIMKDFLDYKDLLEKELIDVSCLYSGDVINTENNEVSKLIGSNTFDKSFVNSVLVLIYEKSIEKMFEKSEVKIIRDDGLNKLDDIIPNFSVRNRMTFVNKKYKKRLLVGITQEKNKKILPSYFYHLSEHNDFYYSPLIDKSTYEDVLYIVQNPIQAFVYSLQNMEYIIEEKGDIILHTIKYNFYDCDYKSLKIIIRDLQKYRNAKLKCLK